MDISTQILSRWQADLQHIVSSAQIMVETISQNLSPLTAVDILLTFILLWWLYRKLRRTELIKVLPRVILLLIGLLASYIIGASVLFYVFTGLLLMTLVATGSLYAPEIRILLQGHVAESAPGSRITTAGQQGVIKVISHAAETLLNARKPALFIIKKGKPLTRLAEQGLKLNLPLKAENLVDAYLTKGEAANGAAVIEGGRLIALGASLKPRTRVQFTPGSATLKDTVKEFNAVAIVVNHIGGGISLLYQNHAHKHLAVRDLEKMLESILI